MKKILPPNLFAISIVIMVGLSWVFPIKRFLAFPFNMIGILVLLVGLGFAKRGSDIFEEKGTNINTFDDPDVLITEGLFQISRNPMYLGFVIALLGISILLGSLSSVFVVAIFFVITDHWYIKFEEEVMAKTFGNQYVEYQTKTRRWL